MDDLSIDVISDRGRETIIDTASSRIGQRLRIELISGRYPPGARIKIRDLAAQYGTSAMPVREALKQLEGEGLLTLLSQKGAVTRKLDAKDISDMYDIRHALEGLLVGRCVDNATDADLAEIEALRLKHEEFAHGGDLRRALIANRNFHTRIRMAADNPRACWMATQGWETIIGLRINLGFGDGRIENTIDEHRALMDAIRARKRSEAIRISQEHAQSAKDDILHVFAEYQESNSKK